MKESASAPLSEIREAIGNHPLARNACDFIVSNLSGVLPALKTPEFVLGKRLEFDATGEFFIDNPEANELLKRKPNGRPFSVPN